jgi:AcrR family transcriptional regulator
MLKDQGIDAAAFADSSDKDPVIADILLIASAEFALHGLAGARIERIVEGTKTSKRMIYYHFGSKEGLYRAVLDQAFRNARKHDGGFDPSAGTPEQALRTMVGNAFDAFISTPDLRESYRRYVFKRFTLSLRSQPKSVRRRARSH